MVDLAFSSDLGALLTTMGAINPDAYYILGGESRTCVGHSIFDLGGEIVWDPPLDDVGIVGPMELLLGVVPGGHFHDAGAS